MSLRLPCVLLLLFGLASCLPAQMRGQNQVKKVAKPSQVPAETQYPLVADFKSFSALVSGGLAHDKERKIYRSADLMRVDFDNGEYHIIDLNGLSTRAVTGNQCAVIPRPDISSYPYSAYRRFKAERSMSTEEETVDGHVCQIENVTLTPPEERPILVKMRLWKAKDLEGFPIKIELVENAGPTITSTYTQVSLKPVDPDLFKHPANCNPWLNSVHKGAPKTAPSKK